MLFFHFALVNYALPSRVPPSIHSDERRSSRRRRRRRRGVAAPFPRLIAFRVHPFQLRSIPSVSTLTSLLCFSPSLSVPSLRLRLTRRFAIGPRTRVYPLSLITSPLCPRLPLSFVTPLSISLPLSLCSAHALALSSSWLFSLALSLSLSLSLSLFFQLYFFPYVFISSRHTHTLPFPLFLSFPLSSARCSIRVLDISRRSPCAV